MPTRRSAYGFFWATFVRPRFAIINRPSAVVTKEGRMVICSCVWAMPQNRFCSIRCNKGERAIYGLSVANQPETSNWHQAKRSERPASVNGKAPCITSDSRTLTPSISPTSIFGLLRTAVHAD